MKVGDLVTLNKRDIGVVMIAKEYGTQMLYRVRFAHETIWLSGVNLEVINESR